MKYHPAQGNTELRNKISDAFRLRMEQKGVLPKNPWKAKRTEAWLAKMGARMKPGSRRFDPYSGVNDCANFLNFVVYCLPSKNKIRHERGGQFMRIEIPWDLADKILVLGHFP